LSPTGKATSMRPTQQRPVNASRRLQYPHSK
jgi:hypothetical protein